VKLGFLKKEPHVSHSEKPLRIDIPVKLAEVKIVFSIGALVFEGDLPASIFHMQLIENDAADWKAKTDVVAVFHTNAGHATLHDPAYNADRNIATGNPYKQLITDLQKRRARRAVRRDREGSPLGKRRPSSWHQGEYGCNGENDPARSRGVRKDYRVSRPGRRNERGDVPAVLMS
jgi:hypothetical protein